MKKNGDSGFPHVAVCVDQFSSHGRGVMRGIARFVETYGPWSLFIDPLADSRYPRGRSENWHGEGILTYIHDAERAERLRRSPIPTVEMFAYRMDRKLPLVAHDDHAVGRMGAEHLLERHFRRFAFSGYAGQVWCDQRRLGFAAVLTQAGHMDPACLFIRRPGTLAEWEAVQQKLTSWILTMPKPVGLMACSDHHAQRVLDACRRANVVVPEEVAVVGVDNDEEICRLSTPPLTSVILDSERVGYESAKLLDALMQSEIKPDQCEPVLIPPLGVATRQSTDVTAVNDPLVATAMRRIRERACAGLSVEELVKLLNTSRSIVYQRFHDLLGRSPHYEIQRVQLARVRNLLLQTPLPLERIAEISGFSNANYLSVAFKREMGLTPGEYRHQAGRVGTPGVGANYVRDSVAK
jgi:LacI family transcriptional regulator